MFTEIRKYILQNEVKLVLIDSDGTIKDLKLEHMTVIRKMCARRGGSLCNSIIRLNEFFISFIKSGILPTNKNMQIILCFLNSLLFGETFRSFKEEYFREYYNTKKVFKDVDILLEEIKDTGARCIIVSKNLQSKNFLSDPILESQNIIINKSKLTGFKQAIEKASISEQHDILPNQILIIGDNFWDDVIPAIRLGATVLWCNKYNSRLKGELNQYLMSFYGKALNNAEGKSIW